MVFKYAFAILTALFACVGHTKAANCQAVADFEALKSKPAAGKNLRIGPGGFYADTANDGCFFLSVDQPSLKEEFPILVETYHSVIKNLTDPGATPAKAALDPLATPGCGQPCDPNQGCLVPCACRFQYQFCDPYGCFVSETWSVYVRNLM